MLHAEQACSQILMRIVIRSLHKHQQSEQNAYQVKFDRSSQYPACIMENKRRDASSQQTSS
jgi:hypothetical protein